MICRLQYERASIHVPHCLHKSCRKLLNLLCVCQGSGMLLSALHQPLVWPNLSISLARLVAALSSLSQAELLTVYMTTANHQ